MFSVVNKALTPNLTYFICLFEIRFLITSNDVALSWSLGFNFKSDKWELKEPFNAMQTQIYGATEYLSRSRANRTPWVTWASYIYGISRFDHLPRCQTSTSQASVFSLRTSVFSPRTSDLVVRIFASDVRIFTHVGRPTSDLEVRIFTLPGMCRSWVDAFIVTTRS